MNAEILGQINELKQTLATFQEQDLFN